MTTILAAGPSPGERLPLAATSRPVPQGARPRVVIVGAGFAGLAAARALGGSAAEVTIIDRQNHHTFQPLLYQVATAALSPAEIAWPVRMLVRRWKNVRPVMAEVMDIDLERRAVHTSRGDFGYDFLVLAAGASHSYFGHAEWAAAAPGLKTIDDATLIRRRVLTAFEEAEVAGEPAVRNRLMSIVVVGGGPTGVEMAGALAELTRDALRRDFRRIDPVEARIVLIEAGPRILPALPVHLAAYARRTLESMGVEVRTDARVTACDTTGVALDQERIEAATIIWAAGVAAAPIARGLRAGHDRVGRVVVGADLSLANDPAVFVVGDASAPPGRPVPGTAAAAKQMGRHAGELIHDQLCGPSNRRSFVYRHAGDLATVGRSAAVVKLGRLELTGFAGWLFWSVVHVYFLVGLRNRRAVATDWLWTWFTRQRSARLITGTHAA